ncbi:MAG: fibronectin type II domain-containing protein [Dysgonomonas mossii]
MNHFWFPFIFKNQVYNNCTDH